MTKKPAHRSVGQHHGDLKRVLIDAAVRMLDRGEKETLTLREIARLAGVSPAAPYHHFADKNELLATVAEEGFRALDVALDAAAASGRTARSRLARMASRYLTFALEHRAHYRVMVGPLLAAAERSSLGDAAMSSFRKLADAVSAANPASSESEAMSLAMFAWALTHGVVMLSMDGALTALGANDVDRLARLTGEQVARMVEATRASST